MAHQQIVQPPNQPNRNHNGGKVYITVKEFEAKYRDKREIYRFLASDVKCYLDSYETMTIWHLKDLAAGNKRKILSKHIKHIDIPQYEGLSISNLMEYAREHQEVMHALPIEREIKKLSRQYIANVIFTLVGSDFQHWVDDRISKRNQKVTNERNLNIEFDEDVAEIFRSSNAVSVNVGKGHAMMKMISKRRRTKQEVSAIPI